MKYSKYVMAGLWDVPESITSPAPVRWDVNGNATHFQSKPSFIAKYKTDANSPEGYLVCVRKMGIDPIENN